MFRNIAIILLCVSIFQACNSSQKSDTPSNAIDPSIINNPESASASSGSHKNFPVFKFEKDTHDFGTITQGEKVSYAFNFKNVGTGDLIIRAAQGSCGCTVPEFPKDPIKPGDGGIINVTFNSEGREGQQNKTVTLISNTMPNTYIITITGDVKKE